MPPVSQAAVNTPRSPRKPSPYPGFDPDTTDTSDDDKLGVRVKPEAEAFYLRNRGSIQNWAFHGGSGENDAALTIQYPRCPTSASLDNFFHDKRGTVKPLLEGSVTPRPETAPARIKPEAEDIADVSRGGRMRHLLTKYGEIGATPRMARVKPEAEETAEVAKGKRMDKLIHSYGKIPLSYRAVPRVKPEAETTAEVSKGKRMERLIHRYGQSPDSTKAIPRVKTEAADNAELDKGKRMNRLVHKYGKPQLSSRAVPRVTVEGSENAELDKGKRMDKLMHSGHTLLKSPSGPPRVKHLEGNNNLYRGRGSMGRVFREMGRRTCVFVPGVSKSRYLKPAMM